MPSVAEGIAVWPPEGWAVPSFQLLHVLVATCIPMHSVVEGLLPPEGRPVPSSCSPCSYLFTNAFCGRRAVPTRRPGCPFFPAAVLVQYSSYLFCNVTKFLLLQTGPFGHQKYGLSLLSSCFLCSYLFCNVTKFLFLQKGWPFGHQKAGLSLPPAAVTDCHKCLHPHIDLQETFQFLLLKEKLLDLPYF
jgi:hypothetical protein